MNAGAQRLCAWCGPLWIVLFFVGFWVIAGFVPPPSPADSAAQVAAFFQDNANSIRLGLLLTCFAGTLTVPWAAAISVQLKRLEGRFSPFTYAQLALGACLPFEFIVPIGFWQAAAFRPGRSPEIIQTLNDLGWLPFTGLIYTVALQAIVIGVAVLMDKRGKPVFPRWFGYFSIAAALLFCPAGLDVFFRNGPLAWNGLIAWWVLLIAFFLWTVALSALLFAAIRSQEAAAVEAKPELAPQR